MSPQLDLFTYRTSTDTEPQGRSQSPESRSPARAREKYEAARRSTMLLHYALDQLDFALDAIRQAQEVCIVNLEKPENRIAIAIRELWAALDDEHQLS
jgi:hypothetical protein